MSVYAVVNNENDRKALQEDLGNLFFRCTKLGLNINCNKSKVIHFC